MNITKIGEPLCKDFVINPKISTIVFTVQFVIYLVTFWNYFRKIRDAINSWIRFIIVSNNFLFLALVINNLILYILVSGAGDDDEARTDYTLVFVCIEFVLLHTICTMFCIILLKIRKIEITLNPQFETAG